jgi:hypothetical protein
MLEHDAIFGKPDDPERRKAITKLARLEEGAKGRAAFHAGIWRWSPLPSPKAIYFRLMARYLGFIVRRLRQTL